MNFEWMVKHQMVKTFEPLLLDLKTRMIMSIILLLLIWDMFSNPIWEDAIFKGYLYKTGTPLFNNVVRSQYGNGCDFENEIIGYRSII